jgi:hypothetical protein
MYKASCQSRLWKADYALSFKDLTEWAGKQAVMMLLTVNQLIGTHGHILAPWEYLCIVCRGAPYIYNTSFYYYNIMCISRLLFTEFFVHARPVSPEIMQQIMPILYTYCSLDT